MRLRTGGLWVGLAAALGPAALGQPAATAPTAGAKTLSLYALDLRVRKPGVKDFNKDTPKLGVEFFKDAAANAVVAITEKGSLAVAPGYTPGPDKKADWLFAHDLRARKGDEEKFTAAAQYGVEAFKDVPSGRLLYATTAGTVALADAPAAVKSDADPAWHHALVLKVRGPAETSFAGARKFGVEAFKDGNTGGLLYISETGSLAAAPAPPAAPEPDRVKVPKALHGLTLRVRKAGEADFGPATKKVGVEVFRDENTGGLVYISDTGSVATAPAPATVQTGKGVTWTHAMELKARPGGEPDFAKATKYGIEAFRDNNTGHTVYVADTGAIAVLPGK